MAQPTLPDDIRTIIGAADQTKRQLTAEELERICDVSDANALVAVHLQERATALVDQARSCLLREQHLSLWSLVVLHPAERATACWRDCWKFFRVIVYSYVCCRPDFTDPSGNGSPAAAVRADERSGAGVEHRPGADGEAVRWAEITDADAQAALMAAFRHLKTELNKTAVKS